jgi:hypothetical protein
VFYQHLARLLRTGPALIVFDLAKEPKLPAGALPVLESPERLMPQRNPQMLHIHNGDSTAGTAKQSDIPGEHLAWREALVCGPAPDGLTQDEFRNVRARHLAGAYGVDLRKCEDELCAQEEALSRFPDHEEVVLWFEHDLFCMVQLIFLLNRLAQSDLGPTKLSLIFVREFPGISDFHGLGHLNEEQLSSLFPQRQTVTAAQLDLGSKAWAAYSSSNPKEIESLLDSDLSALPFLKTALTKHLRRFPSTDNGLGRIGNAGLALVARGHHKFRSLFPAFARRETEYGFGDAQLYLELKRLADASTPPLKLSGSGNRVAKDSVQMLLTSFEITEYGKAVLAGEADFIRSNGIDQWLGGVHLEGNEAEWRWDEQAQELLVRL